jgi:hypothetical protein
MRLVPGDIAEILVYQTAGVAVRRIQPTELVRSAH